MTLKAYYETINGNYEEAVNRFSEDAKIIRYLKKLPNSTGYSNLCSAMEKKEYDLAFKAVHNMKGVLANMAMTELFDLSSLVTEDLRYGLCTNETLKNFESLKDKYEKAVRLLDEI